MNGRRTVLEILCSAAAVLSLLPTTTSAQIFARPFQPSPAGIAELDAAGRRQLERARKSAAEGQPAEAVEALRQLAERHGRQWILASASAPAGDLERFLPVSRYVQEELLRWRQTAPAAVRHYRELVDARAAELLQRGVDRQDEDALHRVGEQFLASSSGFEACLRLGDLALERGEYSSARGWYDSAALVDSNDKTPSERRTSLARLETTDLKSPGETFAVDTQRRGGSDGSLISLAGKPRWSVKLPRIHSDREVLGAGRQRVADDMKAIQAYHPLIVGDTVLLRHDAAGRSTIAAYALANGQALWRNDQEFVLPDDTELASPELTSDAHRGLSRHVGVARYTLTAWNHHVFSRIGSPLTAPAERRLGRIQPRDQGVLMGGDLRSEGKPLDGFPLYPDGPEWAFEGTPLVDDGLIFVAMTRREGSRRQLHIACYERLTTPLGVIADRSDGRFRGRLRWRTAIATGDTVGAGELDEISHTLLAREGGLLFVNSNLGAVAAVDLRGTLQWLVRYPRAKFSATTKSGQEEHYFRDLTPPVVCDGKVIVAPADCERIFALDAADGRFAWITPPNEAGDVVHLLGVANGLLLASGRRLIWIEVQSGKFSGHFPETSVADDPKSTVEPLGRGCLTADSVLWPTRQSLLVFPLRPRTREGNVPIASATQFSLSERGVTGGNLVLGSGTLLIATGTDLHAFDFGAATGQGSADRAAR